MSAGLSSRAVRGAGELHSAWVRGARRAALTGVILYALLAVPALGFSGLNGRLAFSDIYGVHVIGSDGGTERLLSPLPPNSPYDSEPAWSPDGATIAFRTRSPDSGTTLRQQPYVGLMRPEGSQRRILTDGDNPAWSPDGQWLAFSRRDRLLGTRDVYIIRANGSDERRLTSGAMSERSPAWSPDGKRIAFVTNRDTVDGKQNIEIYSMNADGTDQVDLTRSAAPDDHPAWSPDGTKIVFDRDGQTGDIWVMNADGSGQTQLTHDRRSLDPAWSPDGALIAYSSDAGDWGPAPGARAYRTYLMTPAGEARGIVRDTLAPGDMDPDWQALAPPVPVRPPIVNPPMPPRAGSLRVVSRTARASRSGALRLTVACAARGSGCRGRVELRTTSVLRCRGRALRPSVVASVPYGFTVGARSTLQLRLTRSARSMLSCRRRLAVHARTLATGGAKTITSDLRIVPA